jgi:hypothetical protein
MKIIESTVSISFHTRQPRLHPSMANPQQKILITLTVITLLPVTSGSNGNPYAQNPPTSL